MMKIKIDLDINIFQVRIHQQVKIVNLVIKRYTTFVDFKHTIIITACK